MYTNLSGQIAAFKNLEIISNNLANMNTTGYKAERALFEKTLQNQDAVLTTSLRKDIRLPNNQFTENFTAIKGTFTDLTPGNLENTGNPLDAGVNGKGFFVVQTPQGERYTKAGSFSIDAQGRLVTQSGHPVQGSGGDISIGAGLVTIAGDGTVNVDGKSAGKLRIVELDPSQTTREAGQLFAASGGVTDVEAPIVVGGALESSNVNAVRELADMILTSRLFESFKSAQEAQSRLSQLRNEKIGSTQG